MIRQAGLTGKRVMISTTIPIQDYEYAKKNRLMFSRLLENAISIHRTAQEEGISENYLNYLKLNMARLNKRLAIANTFLEEKGLIDEFMKEQMKNDAKN